jgi:hypothetical protein
MVQFMGNDPARAVIARPVDAEQQFTDGAWNRSFLGKVETRLPTGHATKIESGRFPPTARAMSLSNFRKAL